MPATDIPNYQLYGQVTKPCADLEVHIQTIDAFNEKFGHFHHAHRHPDLYQISWITAGSGQHSIDTEAYELQPNSLYVLSPSIVHTCHSSTNLAGYVLHFSPSFLSNKYLEGFQSSFQVHQVSATDYELVNFVFQQIHREFNQVQTGSQQIIRAMIITLLAYLERSSFAAKSIADASNAMGLSQQFQQLVNQYFSTEKRLSFYAQQLHISTVYLKEVIKEMTGISASEVIQKRIILEAKRQLIYSQLTVSEIAYRLGFSDANYFFKYFKRYTGKSPGSYRKERK
ncbi:MAG: helix-turn-helix transcriptional regulator [Bacteroidota bacterium]